MTVIVILATTNLIYYFAIEPFTSELGSFFTVTPFLYCWHEVVSGRRRSSYLLLGGVAGFMAAERQQNAAFMMQVLIDLVWRGWKESRFDMTRLFRRGILVPGGILLEFLPQMIA